MSHASYYLVSSRLGLQKICPSCPKHSLSQSQVLCPGWAWPMASFSPPFPRGVPTVSTQRVSVGSAAMTTLATP